MLVVRLRGAVVRDRQSREIEAVYGAEGTARIGLTLERLLAGLDTLGVERETAMKVVEAVALDSVPPSRRRAYEYLRDAERRGRPAPRPSPRSWRCRPSRCGGCWRNWSPTASPSVSRRGRASPTSGAGSTGTRTPPKTPQTAGSPMTTGLFNAWGVPSPQNQPRGEGGILEISPRGRRWLLFAASGFAEKVPPRARALAVELAIEEERMSKTEPKSWRDVITIHPAADLFPMMSPDELKALGEDIRRNGMTAPIVWWTEREADIEQDAAAEILSCSTGATGSTRWRWSASSCSMPTARRRRFTTGSGKIVASAKACRRKMR